MTQETTTTTKDQTDSEHNTSDTAHDPGSVFLIQAKITQ